MMDVKVLLEENRLLKERIKINEEKQKSLENLVTELKEYINLLLKEKSI